MDPPLVDELFVGSKTIPRSMCCSWVKNIVIPASSSCTVGENDTSTLKSNRVSVWRLITNVIPSVTFIAEDDVKLDFDGVRRRVLGWLGGDTVTDPALGKRQCTKWPGSEDPGKKSTTSGSLMNEWFPGRLPLLGGRGHPLILPRTGSKTGHWSFSHVTGYSTVSRPMG